METLKAIATRRSIRRYENKPVEPGTVTTLLKAAMQAPSAMNQQPWHFVVIDDRKTRETIAAQHPHADECADAPVVIVVCGDTSTLAAPDHWPQDCSAATQNLLLAAHDVGLGAVWSAIYPNSRQVAVFQRILHLPDHVFPFAVVPIGYPAEEKAPEDRYSADRVHSNQW
jgi:nitroreductase